MSSIDAYTAGPVAEEPVLTEEFLEEFWDSVNGGYLDSRRVWAARSEEIAWVESSDLFDVFPRSGVTSKPIPLKWIDTNKGDDANPNYRSRLVLRDIKARKRPEQRMEAVLEYAAVGGVQGRHFVDDLKAPELERQAFEDGIL